MIMAKNKKFYKKNETDTIIWVESEHVGEHLFTFDKKRIFNLFPTILGNFRTKKKQFLTRKIPNGLNTSKTENEQRRETPPFVIWLFLTFLCVGLLGLY